ncbi:MAG: molybdopterin-guanine dinucleotide biosynthesis protein B [Pseudomonadota bacterium]
MTDAPAPPAPVTHTPNGTPVIGIVGWKQAGKTTLTTRLIAHFAAGGLRVASVKHAHHALSVDDGATDSARHRASGASQVAVASSRLWAIITETPGSDEPDLAMLLAKLDPADLCIVEGFKTSNLRKIEARRAASDAHTALLGTVPNVVAIATDRPGGADNASETRGSVPEFDLDDIAGLAAFIVELTGCRSPGP